MVLTSPENETHSRCGPVKTINRPSSTCGGDDGATTGGRAADSNLGWKGGESYVAGGGPSCLTYGQDPQERYDIFMN